MRAGSDDHGFPPLTATLASPGSPKADYDAAAIKLPPDPPRDPKQQQHLALERRHVARRASRPS